MSDSWQSGNKKILSKMNAFTSSCFSINEIVNCTWCAYWKYMDVSKSMFLLRLFKKNSREASNLFSRLEEISLLCSTHLFDFALGVVYDKVVSWILCMVVGGKMDKMSRVNVWCYLKGFMSLKLIKQLVASPRQSYYCTASKWNYFFLILLGCFMLWINGTVGKSESAVP